MDLVIPYFNYVFCLNRTSVDHWLFLRFATYAAWEHLIDAPHGHVLASRNLVSGLA